MISEQIIKNQLAKTLEKTNFLCLGKKYEGKVRDNYISKRKRIIVTTDRISAFDRVLCTIPFKGQVLNQISAFWFENTGHIISNHLLDVPDPNVMVVKECMPYPVEMVVRGYITGVTTTSAWYNYERGVKNFCGNIISYHLLDVPDPNVMAVKECKPYPVEMVVRGYITGVTTTSAWYNYERGVKNFCGNILPDDLKKNQRLDKPILTPTTKADKGEHDISISKEYILEKKIIDEEIYNEIEKLSLKLFEFGTEVCAKNNLILVDTKYEFGDCNGELTLIDEIHTPDSSRFWIRDSYERLFKQGREPEKLDKEYVRQWLAGKGFVGDGQIPSIPDDVKIGASKKYIQAYEMITGKEFEVFEGDVLERIMKNLKRKGYNNIVCQKSL